MSKITKILNKNFTISDTRVAQCKEIDLLAKGLYIYIASLPDDWHFSIERIARANNTTEGKVKNAIKQLEAVGLLRREYALHVNGRRGTTANYVIFDFDTRDLESPINSGLKSNPLTPQKLVANKVGDLINNKNTKNQEYKELNYKSPRLQNPLGFSDSPPEGESESAPQLESEGLTFEEVSPQGREENYPQEFQEFWASYPSKANKANAYKCFQKAIKKSGVNPSLFISKAQEYANYCKSQGVWIAHASTWLNQERYLNDYKALSLEKKGLPFELSKTRGSRNHGSNDEDGIF